MSEEQPNQGLTSAEIKKQIEEATKASKAKKELQSSGMPLTGMIANEINATENSTPEIKPQPVSKAQPEKAPETKATDQSVDFREWAKKKGIDWTTDDSVLAALHKSDQEFHKKRAEKKSGEAPSHPSYQPSSYPPPPYPNNLGYPPPAYAPNQKQMVENIARQYNMLPEDVERLAAFNRDFFEVSMRAERERHEAELRSMKIENQKNSVFRELSSDPVFRRPDVAVEFHRVLEQMQDSDPQSFEENPTAYRIAFDRAVNNIGRRYLEGHQLQEGVPPQAVPITPPMTPPRPLGTSSGGGALENEQGIDPKEYAKLPLEEKRKLLDKMGLRTAY